MTFSEALEAMKQGHKVRQKKWSGNVYIGIVKNHFEKENGVVFTISSSHIFATDWEIYNEPDPEPQFEIGELVMMRDSDAFVWEAKHFSRKVDAVEGGFRYRAIDGSIYRQCAKFDKDIVFTNKPVKK